MIGFIIRQRRAVNLFFIVLIVLGILSLSKLGTAELPEPPGSGVNVSAVLPGASPGEMDKKVARLLHDAIKDLAGIKDVVSYSREAYVSLSVTFLEDEGDHAALEREVAQMISQVPDLPAELEGPYVSRNNNYIFPAMTLLLEGGSDLERHQAWYKIKQIIKGIKEVDGVETLGDRKRRIEIRLNAIKLQQLGVRIDQVSRILRQAFTDQSAGRQESFLSLNRIRVKAHPDSIEALAKRPIRLNGHSILLEQFADIHEVLEPKRLHVNHNGNAAWYINIYRRDGTKMSALSEQLNAVIEKQNAIFKRENSNLKLLAVQDRNFIVERELLGLSHSILLGMLLVLLILWCFFGLHNAVYAAIGIPFSFFAAFIMMDILGMDLNTLTLFGLVLVCGMIVDDSIVVLENIYRKIEQGKEKVAAIKDGLVEVLPAVLASTATTVAAFLPLLLMTGEMGEFISQIPKVAILALCASLVECLIILPVHIYQRKSRPVRRHLLEHNVFNQAMERCAEKFAEWVSYLIQKPFQILLAFVGILLVTCVFAYCTMDFQMFNASEVRSIRAHLILPKNIDLGLNSLILEKKRKALEEIEYVEDVIILSGWSDYNYSRSIKSHLATIEFVLDRAAFEYQIAQGVSDNIQQVLNTIPGLEKSKIVLEKNKPPVSVPVRIYLYGNDGESLGQASDIIREKLAAIPSIKNISNPMEDGIPEKVFKINEDMAAYYDLDAKEIGRLLHIAITGEKIAKMDRGDEIVDIYVLSNAANDWRARTHAHITLSNGQLVPIESLGVFVEQLSPDAVKRYQGNRYIAITADIDESKLSNYKTHREIERLITPELLPEGVSFEQLGEFSSTQKSLTSMYQSALLALGLAYMILTVLFRSYVQPLLVLLTIPLAYIGVVWGMTLMGQQLSLMGLIGIIGLIGIVVNDALVWVNCYNRLCESGETGRTAAVNAVRIRFRPIMLTTITTVLGLLPLSLMGNAGIAGAMADTIVSGLVAASFLLILFLPVCVVLIDELDLRAIIRNNLQQRILYYIYKFTGRRLSKSSI